MNPSTLRRIASRLSIPKNVAEAVADYNANRRDNDGKRYTLWGLCCLHGIADERTLQDAVYNVEKVAKYP